MASVTSASVCLFLLFYISSVSASDAQNISAQPGENVTLTCRIQNNNTIIVVEWSRTDLKTKYVFLYRDGQSDTNRQHQSFKNRVELKHSEMKNEDAALILKNVTINDTGTYECRVELKETNRKKRSYLETDPISIINLTVRDSGGDKDEGDKDGHVGLAVGLSVLVVVVVGGGGFLMYRKHKGVKEQNSYTAPGEKDTDHQQV